MSHTLTWPGKYFFYPIGNTSAVCLTRDLAPEDPANILLLGCGDPRNVLFTLYNEPAHTERRLDFTCCDIDPAILARHIILFTMVTDKQASSIIWNFFFHMKLDKASYDALIAHCEKLLSLSETMEQWNACPYGASLRFCTAYTWSEVRRHLSLYVASKSMSAKRQKEIRMAFEKLQADNSGDWVNFTPARSCGPLVVQALPVVSQQFHNYWKTGTTFSSPKDVAAATYFNPTFLHSLGGEGCCVHYGTDPMTPFHLAEVFANTKSDVTVKHLVAAAQNEFEKWCNAYQSLSSKARFVIRHFAGDALAMCQAVDKFNGSRILKTSIPVAPWKASRIEFGKEYLSGDVPTVFNVIETSNLDDHLGLLNVLIASIPLRTENGIMYSESLLFNGDDATKDFKDRLYADITVIAFLLGVCPLDYLSSFNSRSNTHELMMNVATKKFKDTKSPTVPRRQFHQVITWKAPHSGDALAQPHPLHTFNPTQLANLLWDIYHGLFEQEDATNFWGKIENKKSASVLKAIGASNVVHYSRETFVLLLKLIRHRLCIPDEEWMTVIDRFMDIQDADRSMPIDTCNRQELWGLWHYHGIHTVDIYHRSMPKVGKFAKWSTVTPLVRIVLTVPRHKLSVLGFPAPMDPKADTTTIPLHCIVRGRITSNSFNAVHVAFGRVSAAGNCSNPRIAFEEDFDGWNGTAPLVASFVMPIQLLVFHEPQADIVVNLCVRSTPSTARLVRELGLELAVFSARLLDEEHVQVLPEYPSNKPFSTPDRTSPQSSQSTTLDIGPSGNACIELDEDCELVSTLTRRVQVQSNAVQRLFGSEGATPQIIQLSPCVMRLSIGSYKQDVAFPFPVIGSANKLRLARKSLYIEVVVPPVEPFHPDNMKMQPFPIVGHSPALTGWNIHRVNLSRLPLISVTGKAKENLEKWYNPHVGSIMSTREKKIRDKEQKDILVFVKDSLHSMFVRSAGIQGSPRCQVFTLHDTSSESKNCDTIIFVENLRLDVQAHTVVADGYVLPLSDEIITKNQSSFGRLVSSNDIVQVMIYEGEMSAWKHLLPAFVERCRSWQHGANCEYKSTGKIPLTEKMEEIAICSCGRGKDVEGMKSKDLWRPFAKYSTRLALSPLFAISYLERVGRNPTARKCHLCRSEGKPKLLACGVCKKTRYCSRECQKADWKKHKEKCKA